MELKGKILDLLRAGEIEEIERMCAAIVAYASTVRSDRRFKKLQKEGVLAGEVLRRLDEFDLRAVEAMVSQ